MAEGEGDLTRRVSQGTGDYTPYVLRMKAQHPDYLLVSTTQADSARYTTAVAAQGALPSRRILGLVTLADEVFINAVPQEVAELVSAVAPNSPPGSKQAAECVRIVQRYSPKTSITSLASVAHKGECSRFYMTYIV